MNIMTKLQVVAGIAAVIALPLMYFGLQNGSLAMPLLGIVLFLLAMLVTPVLRVLPSRLMNGEDH